MEDRRPDGHRCGGAGAHARSDRPGWSQPAARSIEKRVDDLLSRMTTAEKLQQVQLLSDGQITDADARNGVGSVFSLVVPDDVSNLRLTKSRVSRNGSLTARVDVTNTGGVVGDEVVQLYLSDPVASISQPVRRLRGFQRVTLEPGKSTTVTFTLDRSDWGFYDNRGKFVRETGRIDLYAGSSSAATMTKSFTVTQ